MYILEFPPLYKQADFSIGNITPITSQLQDTQATYASLPDSLRAKCTTSQIRPKIPRRPHKPPSQIPLPRPLRLRTRIVPKQILLKPRIRPRIRILLERPLLQQLPVALLLDVAVAAVVDVAHERGRLHDARGARLADAFVDEEQVFELGGVGDFFEERAEDGAVFDGHGCALGSGGIVSSWFWGPKREVWDLHVG
jgi:hypothetical protein